MTVEISRGHNPLRDPEDRRLNRIAGPSALVIEVTISSRMASSGGFVTCAKSCLK